MSRRVRVLLADIPHLLRASLERLLQHHRDIEVVETVIDPVELLIAVEDTQADVVVVTLPDSGEMPGICSHLFAEYPQLLILALSSDRTRACIYKQVTAVEQLIDTSEEEILKAIRQAKANIAPE
jgi:DNA-binding NarL/FixJ family response regulator